jgi:2-oxo-4-hydroxy-4-carboxy-5-ureidoimidazoline decarboxylase
MASTISKLNQSNLDDFVRVVGPVFEHSPWIASAVWNQRPFAGWKQLHHALCAAVISVDDQRKLDLIQAYPDLVGGATQPDNLTPASKQELATAGLDKLSPDEAALFQKQNATYREKFGFPFIICAQVWTKETIVAGFEQRLKHSREDEIQTALEEIFKIAELRLGELARA